MNRPVTVAAIIPTYQRASIVGRAIESVLRQTRPVDEIIVVDDGGNDDTERVVAGYGSAVRYIRRTNGGLSAARNTGVRASSSDWVAFLDDDDAWTDDKISKQVNAIEAAVDASICYAGMWMLLPDGRHELILPKAPEELWPSLRLSAAFSPNTLMVRRDVFWEVGGFDERLRCAEDWNFCVRVVPGRHAVRVNEPLLLGYESPNTMSRATHRMLLAELSILSVLLRDLHGIAAWTWRCRILSRIYYRAAISAREAGTRYLPYLLKSLLYWPLSQPKRYKTLALALREIGS